MLGSPPLALRATGGNNSAVECDLAKVEVAGSNPVSRSNLEFFRTPTGVLFVFSTTTTGFAIQQWWPLLDGFPHPRPNGPARARRRSSTATPGGSQDGDRGSEADRPWERRRPAEVALYSPGVGYEPMTPHESSRNLATTTFPGTPDTRG